MRSGGPYRAPSRPAIRKAASGIRTPDRWFTKYRGAHSKVGRTLYGAARRGRAPSGVRWLAECWRITIARWLGDVTLAWGLLTAAVISVVRDPNHTPYCDKSSVPTLARILGEQWPHEDVLGALPGDLGRT